ncbi:MAG TPA: hypothetical protein VK447_15460 [Myxococcaceae bacterium]|nr:hypothetical protein [Myxococcaceae bacterium]
MNRSLPLLATLALAWLSAPAAAQDTESPLRPGRLYLNNSLLVGSGRVVSLGGAYVGIAEGGAGFASNLAAIAQRNPELERDWDADVLLSYLTVPRREFDLDNDGRFDDQYRSTTQLLLGLALQYKNYGLGAYTRATFLSYCATGEDPCTDQVQVTVANSSLAAAVGFGDDELIAALGLYLATATFSHRGDNWDYANTGFAFDMLYRPRNRPYRIGISVKPQVVGRYRVKEDQQPVVAGKQLFTAVVSPPVLSLGASYLIGPGAERYNRLSPAARRQALEEAEGRRIIAAPPPEPTPKGALLLTGQVDIVSAVENAVPLGAFLSTDAPPEVGNATYLVPRFGAEYEPIPGRLRTRLGTFLEPSPFAGRPVRPHLTGGFELFVLHYYVDWEVAGTFDIAPLYTNVGVSIGFWK